MYRIDTDNFEVHGGLQELKDPAHRFPITSDIRRQVYELLKRLELGLEDAWVKYVPEGHVYGHVMFIVPRFCLLSRQNLHHLLCIPEFEYVISVRDDGIGAIFKLERNHEARENSEPEEGSQGEHQG